MSTTTQAPETAQKKAKRVSEIDWKTIDGKIHWRFKFDDRTFSEFKKTSLDMRDSGSRINMFFKQKRDEFVGTMQTA